MKKNNKIQQFNNEKKTRIKSYGKSLLKKSAQDFFQESISKKYSYNFNWFGIPIIQYPQDIIKLQEIILQTKPDLIIETGIAHGGSVLFSASMMHLLDISESSKKNEPPRMVLAIDIDFKKHNFDRLYKNTLSKKIKFIKGSSTSKKIGDTVKNFSKKYKKIMVILDSNHTHDHVYKELNFYANLVSKNCYCVVFDTFISEYKGKIQNRPWNSVNNPLTAITKFMKRNKNFKIDKDIDNQLLISAAPNGYLKRIK